MNMQVGFLPPQDMIENAKTIEDFFVLGHIMTAMPPIHAIPAVVAAPPGIATYNDLPLPQARGIVPTELAPAHRFFGHRRFAVASTVFRHDKRSAVARGA